MSEPEVGTKAPQSDGAAAPIVSNDSPSPAGASMGEHCATDRPSTGQRPTGELTKFKDIDVYASKPADYPHSPSKLLLLLTGGTGIKSTNNQLQADMYASQGFLGDMSDQFSRDAASTTTTAVDRNSSLIDHVKLT